MVRSEVYLNKYVVSIAPFSTRACPDCSQNIQKTALFCMFALFNFLAIFPGGGGGQAGQLTPFAPMCGRPCRKILLLRRARQNATIAGGARSGSACQRRRCCIEMKDRQEEHKLT